MLVLWCIPKRDNQEVNRDAVEQMAGETYVTAEFVRRWDAVEYAMNTAQCFTAPEMKAHPRLAPALERWLSRDLEPYATHALRMGMSEIREELSDTIKEVADSYLDSFADLADEPTAKLWAMCKAAGETLRQLEKGVGGSAIHGPSLEGLRRDPQ